MRASRLLALGIGPALLLSGCAAPASEYGDPGWISVAIVQGRDDRGARIVAFEVTSQRDDAVDITRAELDAPQLKEPAVWDRGTTLRPGLTIDLRVPLGEPACPLAENLTPSVALSFTTEEGIDRTITVTPEQPTGVLDRIAQEDCLADAVTGSADITVKAVEYALGSHVPAVLVLGIAPKESDTRVTLVGIHATILLALVDPAGNLSQEYPLDRAFEPGGDESDLRISLVPNRCDTHAVAEDKRGTFIPLEVEVEGGATGTYYVTMPDTQKGQLYAFVTDYCS
jgi:hypothetical protein